jgi:hypothetical protein
MVSGLRGQHQRALRLEVRRRSLSRHGDRR